MSALLIAIFFVTLLSIAGIGGFISGLYIKRWPMAAGVGVALGVFDTFVFLETSSAPIYWIMAIFVAVLTATLGWWLRGRKLPPMRPRPRT